MDKSCFACGTDIDIVAGWRCRRCRMTFCGEHRLPENHECAHKAARCDQCGESVKVVSECGCNGMFCMDHRDPEDHDCPIHTSERTHASPPPHLARSQKSWSGRRRSRNRTKPAAAIGAGIAVLVLTVLLAFPTVLPESPTSLVPGVEDIEEGTAEILETISENLEIEHQLEQAKDGEHTTAQIPDLTDTADNNPAKWKAYMNSVS